jgi:pyruvate kinase
MRVIPGKARIVCTLGPASKDLPVLSRMLEVGMDVARLNLSHGSHDDHARMIATVRQAAKDAGVPLCTLLDLQGPKIRIGDIVAGSVDLVAGKKVVITTDPCPGSPERVPTSYLGLPRDVQPGDTILLDDGKLRLSVQSTSERDVTCEIIVGGKLSSRKGLNLPGTALSIPSFTEKDLDDLAFGLAQGVDYTALSFVRSAGDVRSLRAAIARIAGGETHHPIVAKIEKPQALRDIDNIIAESDAIMVARGDLGVEVPPEEVPLHQKSIIAKCNRAGKPVIVATQMFESMITNSTPTRAEASDVANAVLDGADAVMLSGETSVGTYPVEAVAMMTRIINSVETHAGRAFHRKLDFREGEKDAQEALGRAACELAEQIHASAVVAVTQGGMTARIVSHHRPRIPIVAITNCEPTLRRLNLVWGVQSLLVDQVYADSDSTLRAVEDRLITEGVLKRGDMYVLVAGQPLFAGGGTNFVKVERCGQSV